MTIPNEPAESGTEVLDRSPESPPIARLLVADDNPTNRYTLRRTLEHRGHAVAEAEHGQHALDMMRAEAFDLLLLDIRMPVMDGFRVLEVMRTDASLSEIPAIVVSALDELESAVRCIEMGAEDYVFKPFDPVLLRARISASVEKRRLRNEERQKAEELKRALEKLKCTQDQLIAEEKLASLGALTAGIAHEIQNPLNFVLNFAEISVELAGELKEKLNSDAHAELANLASDLELNARKIQEHGERANSIIQSMLMHSRAGSGERRPTNLNALLDQYLTLAYHGMRARDLGFQVAIHRDFDPAIGLVNVIPQDISRAVLNVATNAMYAVRQKQQAQVQVYTPEIWASSRHQEGGVEIRIRDNGPGIPDEIRGRIFEPFFTTKAAGEGTGLGLSLSYDIVVQEHNGEIRVESQPGEGSEFIISIPTIGGSATA